MKTLITFILILTAGILPITCIAQENLKTDRPTEAQTPRVVGKGAFQVEIGLKKEQQNKNVWSVQHPNALFRYGLAKWLELRLETDVETQRLEPSREYGLKPIEAGFKARVYQTSDTAFVAALFGQIGLPGLASTDYQDNKYFYRFRFLLENKITNKISLNYNIGRDWDDQQNEQKWI